jgi:excisionase family DNA binding protein
VAEPEELLTVAEIAATLKMNQQSIRNWIESGYLPAIRLGRRVRVKRSDFDALLEASYTAKPRTTAGGGTAKCRRPSRPVTTRSVRPRRPTPHAIRRLRSRTRERKSRPADPGDETTLKVTAALASAPH